MNENVQVAVQCCTGQDDVVPWHATDPANEDVLPAASGLFEVEKFPARRIQQEDQRRPAPKVEGRVDPSIERAFKSRVEMVQRENNGDGSDDPREPPQIGAVSARGVVLLEHLFRIFLGESRLPGY